MPEQVADPAKVLLGHVRPVGGSVGVDVLDVARLQLGQLDADPANGASRHMPRARGALKTGNVNTSDHVRGRLRATAGSLAATSGPYLDSAITPGNARGRHCPPGNLPEHLGTRRYRTSGRSTWWPRARASCQRA